MIGAQPSTRCVVISAVNFSEGGPLTVLIECLSAAVETLGSEWKIVALVHDAALVPQHPRMQVLAFPKPKRSWAKRLGMEWGGGFLALSRELKPDLWLSLHDITPRVEARRQVVYCHNPSPFHDLTWREARIEPSFALFNLFYAHLYRCFIGRNHAVVVQQSWLRDEFRRRYGHPQIIVAHPEVRQVAPVALDEKGDDGRCVLIYPALPRVFKNFEVLCDAVERLPPQVSARLDLRLTVDGTENRYARELLARYGQVPGLSFIGRQSRQQMAGHYARCAAVLFPSLLETWGLPITEAKALGKPLVVADLPYAHETVGDCAQVEFLPPRDPAAWAQTLERIVEGRWSPGGQTVAMPAQPYTRGWSALWQRLVEGL